MTQTTQLSKSDVVKKLDENVLAVIGSKSIMNFEKAYLVADAIGKLKEMLTDEYMKPIMELRGNRLGFKTDKDIKNPSDKYSVEVVKNCLIEAVLIGVQPTGNQFNIIAGNCYITKEGFGYLLNGISGLYYEISFTLPKVNADKTGAAVTAKIDWKISGEQKSKEVEIPVKMDAYTTVDAIIGKATRKARAWLFNTINGTEVGDGEVEDAGNANVVSSTIKIDKEKERIEALISDCKNELELKVLQDQNPQIDWLSYVEFIENKFKKELF